MKKYSVLLVLAFALVGIHSAQSQKFGYVDTDYILSKLPEYRIAQKEIETISEKWQKEITEMYKAIEGEYNSLQAEQVLLTKEIRDERLAAIRKKEEEVKEYQKKVFGFEGLFFLKKKELIKPIQDRVFDAVERVAKKNRLQFVFDKSGELVMIYTDPIHDYTDFVLEELGYGDENDTVR